MVMLRQGRWTTRPTRGRRRAVVRLERLENRQVLSTTTPGSFVATPAVGSGFGPAPAANSATPPVGAYTPAAIRQAYGFNQVAFEGAAADGSGQTIAIVDAYNHPNILGDLDTFDRQFSTKVGGPSLYDQYGASSSFLTVVNQRGDTTGLPATDLGWAQEIALDVEWAHAIAPGAKIVLVEANSAGLGDLLQAINTAGTKANVVSMSFGGAEFVGETSLDPIYFNKANVTFVAASGDSGALFGPQWPSVSPNVVAVGGTSLSTSGESAWGGAFFSGSTGGVSRFESQPGYQSQAIGNQAGRTTPDVAYNADPRTGFAVYDSLSNGLGNTGWSRVGGTSAGAPQWAALVAIANQGRALNHLPALSSTQTLSGLYGSGASGSSPYFHDVTSGRNLLFSTVKGYDLLTGLGSPAANRLVPFLAVGTITTTTNLVTTGPAPFVNPTSGTTGGTTVSIDLITDTTTTFKATSTTFVLILLSPPAATPPPARNARPRSATAGVSSQARVDLAANVLQLPNQPVPGAGLRPFRGNTDPVRSAPASKKDDGEDDGAKSEGGDPGKTDKTPKGEAQPGDLPEKPMVPEAPAPETLGKEMTPLVVPDGFGDMTTMAPSLMLAAFALAWWRTWRLNEALFEETKEQAPRRVFKPRMMRSTVR